MNSTLDWVELLRESKNVPFGIKILQKSSPSFYFKNTDSCVSLFFTLSATVYPVLVLVHAFILRTGKYILKARHAGLRFLEDFLLK